MPTTDKWEIEFDKKLNNGEFSVINDEQAIKSFISNLLTKAREEGERNVLNLWMNLDSDEIINLDSAKDLIDSNIRLQSRQDTLREVGIEMDKVYKEFENNKPPMVVSPSEANFNEGFYRGELKACEVISQKVFGVSGDLLTKLGGQDEKN